MFKRIYLKQSSYYLLGIISCLILFLILTIIVAWYGPYLHLNLSVFYYADKIQTNHLTLFAYFISFFGNRYVIIPTITLTSLFLFFQGQKRLAWHFWGVIALAAFSSFLLKKFIPIPRPEEHTAILKS